MRPFRSQSSNIIGVDFYAREEEPEVGGELCILHQQATTITHRLSPNSPTSPKVGNSRCREQLLLEHDIDYFVKELPNFMNETSFYSKFPPGKFPSIDR